MKGTIATAVGLGSSLSNIFAGVIVQRSGYTTAFLSLTGIALVSSSFLWFLVPETKRNDAYL